MDRPTGYSVFSYGQMVSCEPRMSAYADALRAAVTPGCTVFDIGAGPGVFSILACQFGAGSVIAIEPDNSIELLRQFARDNGYSDRIEIFQGHSKDYRPSSMADVIVSDIRGCLPLFEGHIQTIADARQRLLKANGKLIPFRDTIRIAIVYHPETYLSYEEPWVSNKFGIDLIAGHEFAISTCRKRNLDPRDLLSEPKDLALLDYGSITDPNLKAVAKLVAETAGTAHGLLLWFDTELAPGIGFSNAPGEPQQIYGQTFFPLELPVELTPGDSIEVEIKANLIDRSYVWSWNSKLFRGSSPVPEVTYRQSSFHSKLLTKRMLDQRSNRFIPLPTPAQAIDRHCLSLIDGQASFGDIAELLATSFPDDFSNVKEALNHVTGLASRYDHPGDGA